MASFLLSVRLRGVATELLQLQLLCWLKRDEVDCWASGGRGSRSLSAQHWLNPPVRSAWTLTCASQTVTQQKCHVAPERSGADSDGPVCSFSPLLASVLPAPSLLTPKTRPHETQMVDAGCCR